MPLRTKKVRKLAPPIAIDTSLPLLTAEQVAARLSVSLRTLYRILDRRQISYYKFNGCFRFDPAAVDRFLEKRLLRAA